MSAPYDIESSVGRFHWRRTHLLQLINELDLAADAEQLGVDEAQRRYDAYLRGELEALPGDDVMARARSRIGAKCLWNRQSEKSDQRAPTGVKCSVAHKWAR